MKKIVFIHVVLLLMLSSYAQSQRVSIRETPDSLTPAGFNWFGISFSRVFGGFFAISYEYNWKKRNGICFEAAIKSSLNEYRMPSRYSFRYDNSFRALSTIYSGRLMYRYYMRAGRKSFCYFNNYFRFDNLYANNKLIISPEDDDWYLLSRKTNQLVAGFGFGFFNPGKRISIKYGVSFGAGMYRHSQTMQELSHNYYDNLEPSCDRYHTGTGVAWDLTLDFVFLFGIKK